ncbi:hypothetical protein M5K25_024130 [Dendrobium thyrsiflorum]|uniref:Riboflavin synthase n=1 Tax=Dendrobium thyrsiflorum TaxID=117978 RepID=A0ABD0U1L0_DENTH
MAAFSSSAPLSSFSKSKSRPPSSKARSNPAFTINFLRISNKTHLKFATSPLKSLPSVKPKTPVSPSNPFSLASLRRWAKSNTWGGYELRIAAKTVLGGVQLGDSISVNGTCLTVTAFDPVASQFSVGLSPETLRKTSLGELGPGSPVNLERALQPTSRMGGHFVQGHVDGTGEIVKFELEGDSIWVKVKTSPELLRYIVPKGFITVDGTSLTVVQVYDEDDCFDFMLVAYTQQKVAIPKKKVGDKVNLEVDILGKYVEKLLRGGIST